jgi:hypothetical protein
MLQFSRIQDGSGLATGRLIANLRPRLTLMGQPLPDVMRVMLNSS